MTERAITTTEPTRRRIGDEDSRSFPSLAADPGTDAVTAPAPKTRRRIGDASGPVTTPVGRSEDRDPVADPPPPDPADRVVLEKAAEPSTAEGTQTEDARPAERRTLPRLSGRVTILVGALVVILLAATIFLGLQVRQQDNLNSLRSSALSSASTDGVLLSSYDYRNLTGPGSAWSKVEKNATPTFRKNFLSTSGSLGKLLSQYNATATGKVITAGVASFSSTRAVVLLFIDQTVNNSVQKSASATQPLRTEVTLLHQNGRWLIDDLQVPK